MKLRISKAVLPLLLAKKAAKCCYHSFLIFQALLLHRPRRHHVRVEGGGENSGGGGDKGGSKQGMKKKRFPFINSRHMRIHQPDLILNCIEICKMIKTFKNALQFSYSFDMVSNFTPCCRIYMYNCTSTLIKRIGE